MSQMKRFLEQAMDLLAGPTILSPKQKGKQSFRYLVEDNHIQWLTDAELNALVNAVEAEHFERLGAYYKEQM